MNRVKQLRYGSVIQLIEIDKEKVTTINETYFFMERIDKNEIHLKQNDGDSIVLSYNDEGYCTDENIHGFVIVYEPKGTEGYAYFHGYVPNTHIVITFTNGDELRGRITNVQEDMITIVSTDSGESLLYFIDFEYRGLHDKLGIQKIEIEELQKEPEDEEDNSEEMEIFIYDMQQQINDYINQNDSLLRKKSIEQDIENYTQLMDLYTDVDNQILLKELPENQFLKSILKLNTCFMTPVTSYVEKFFYNEEGENREHIVLQTNEEFFSEMKENHKTPYKNVIIRNEKNRDCPFHKTITLNQDTPIALIENNGESPLFTNHLYIGNKNRPISHNRNSSVVENDPKMRKNNYTEHFLEKGTKIILNGVKVHRLSQMKSHHYKQPTSLVLSKSLTHIHPYYNYKYKDQVFKVYKEDVNRSHNMKHFFGSNHIRKNGEIYYPITNQDTKWKDFLNRINVTSQNVIEELNIKGKTNIYELLREMSTMHISKVNEQDMKWMKKSVKKEIQPYKNRVQKSTIELSPYEFISNETLFISICDIYKQYAYNTSYPSEILYQTFIDEGAYIIETIRSKHQSLYHTFDEESMQSLLLSINETLQSQNESKMTDSLKPIKTYYSLKELEEDKGKIVLKDSKDPNKTSNSAIFEQLSVFQKFGYKETASSFEKTLDTFLSRYQIHLPMESEEHDDLKDTLFGEYQYKDDLFQNMVTMVLENAVKEGEFCIVRDMTNETIPPRKFTFINQSWIPYEKYQENSKKKKLLKRTSQSMQEFDEIRSSTIHEYIIKMINDYENEQKYAFEKESILETNYLKKNLTLKNNQYMRHLFQYNQNKKEYHFEFQKYIDQDQSLTIHSSYLSLFHYILQQSSLLKRYSCLQTFVGLLTLDMNDKDWLYCAETKTKLVPVFLYELSQVYLNGNKEHYKKMLHYYCNHEGVLSEHGEHIVHKTTGYIIQRRDFNTQEEMFSGNMKLIMDIEDLKKDHDDYDIELSLEESHFGNEALKLLKNLNIQFHPKHQDRCFREMNHIYKEYKYHSVKVNAKEEKIPQEERFIYKIYTIWCFTFVYIQCFDLKITKKVPLCNASFSGFPLYDETNTSGIEYLACMFKNKSKSSKNSIYEGFRKNRTKEYIHNELIQFMKQYVLQNTFIKKCMEEKKQSIEKQKRHKELKLQELQMPKQFSPSLNKIALKPFNEITPSSQMDKIKYNTALVRYRNKEIEYFISETIEHEKYLLTHFEEQEPLFVNYCCNQKFILEYFKTNKTLASLMNETNEVETTLNHLRNVLCNTLAHFNKKNPKRVVETMDKPYDLQTVYLFIITHAHFDNPLPIEPFLLDLIPSKPEDYYDSKDPIDTKIRKLKQHGYEFTSETLTTLVTLKTKTTVSEETTPISHFNTFIENVDYLFVFPFRLIQENRVYLEKCKLHEYNKYESIQIPGNIKRKIEKKFKSFVYQSVFVQKKMIHYLHNLNYFLICIIPQILLHGKRPELSMQYLKKKYPNYAERHNRKLYDMHKVLYDCFQGITREDINIFGSVQEGKLHLLERNEYRTLLNMVKTEHRSVAMQEKEKELFSMAKEKKKSPLSSKKRIKQVIESIASFKDLLQVTLFQSNTIDEYTYMEFLFYKNLNMYNMGTMKESMNEMETQVVYKINESIYRFINHMSSIIFVEYEEVQHLTKQIKQSEKKIMTERFRNAENQQQRYLDKVMLDAKLGDRSIALSKGLFVYDKDLFDEDDEKAKEVQDMRNITYGSNEDETENDLQEESFVEEQEEYEEQDEDLDMSYDEDNETLF